MNLSVRYAPTTAAMTKFLHLLSSRILTTLGCILLVVVATVALVIALAAGAIYYVIESAWQDSKKTNA